MIALELDERGVSESFGWVNGGGTYDHRRLGRQRRGRTIGRAALVSNEVILFFKRWRAVGRPFTGTSLLLAKTRNDSRNTGLSPEVQRYLSAVLHDLRTRPHRELLHVVIHIYCSCRCSSSTRSFDRCSEARVISFKFPFTASLCAFGLPTPEIACPLRLPSHPFQRSAENLYNHPNEYSQWR